MSATQLAPSSKIANAVYLLFSIPLVTYFFWNYFHSIFSDLRAAITVIALVSSFVAAALFYIRLERGIRWLIRRLVFKRNQETLIEFTVKKRLLNEEWKFAIVERWEHPTQEIEGNLDVVLQGPDLHNELWTIYGVFYFLGGAFCSLPILIDAFSIVHSALIHDQVYGWFCGFVVLIIVAVIVGNGNLFGDIRNAALFRGLQETRSMVVARSETDVPLFPSDVVMKEMDDMILRKDWSRFRRRFHKLMDSMDNKFSKQVPKPAEALANYYLDLLVAASQQTNPIRHIREINLVRDIIDTFEPLQNDDFRTIDRWRSVLNFRIEKLANPNLLIEGVLNLIIDTDVFDNYSKQFAYIINQQLPKLSIDIQKDTLVKVIQTAVNDSNMWKDCVDNLFKELCKIQKAADIRSILGITLDWGKSNWVSTPFHIARQVPKLGKTGRHKETKAINDKKKEVIDYILQRQNKKFIARYLQTTDYQNLATHTILRLASEKNKRIDKALLKILGNVSKASRKSDVFRMDLEKYTPSFSAPDVVQTMSNQGFHGVLLVIKLVLDNNLVDDSRNLLELVEGIVSKADFASSEVIEEALDILAMHGDDETIELLGPLKDSTSWSRKINIKIIKTIDGVVRRGLSNYGAEDIPDGLNVASRILWFLNYNRPDSLSTSLLAKLNRITQASIRGHLSRLKKLGYVEIEKDRDGWKLTELGLKYTQNEMTQ